jgi:hypothetical protein
VDGGAADAASLLVSCETILATVRLDTSVSVADLATLVLHLTSATDVEIAGQVAEQGAGKPVIGARVILSDGRGEALSDLQGCFRLEVRGKRSEVAAAIGVHPEYETSQPGLTVSPGNRIALKRKQ